MAGSRLDRKRLAAQARHYGEDAVLFLKALMYGDEAFVSKDGRRIPMDPNAPITERAKAANALLDRGIGKPAQAVNFSDEDGDDVTLTIAGERPADILKRKLLRLAQPGAAGPAAGGTQ